VSRRARPARGLDRNDLLFRAGAFVTAAVSLWLAVVIVMRNLPAGVLALAIGLIAGVAVAAAMPEQSVPRSDGGTPDPPSPPVAGPEQATRTLLREPVAVGAPGAGPAGGELTRPVTRPAAPRHTGPAAVGEGHVLGTGSSAGRAPWHLPARTGQPGIAVDALRLGDLEVRAASVIGPLHRCQDPAVPRQDAYLLARDGRGAHLVVAVADGLSDSPRSDLGARIAVSTAARELTAALDRLHDPAAIDARALFTTVAREITGTARNQGASERDVCCLLVVAAVPTIPAADGSRRVWTAQIGDVSVWTHGPAWRQQAGHAKSGLDRNAVDTVLPFHPGQAVSSVVEVPPGHGVAVVTDGVGDLLNEVADAESFFAHRWAAPPHPASFLADLCVDAPGQGDDRTAVVVWCGVPGQTSRGPR
jgi:hypothetical protein